MKKVFWQKGHVFLFYNNLVGSLYPICTQLQNVGWMENLNKHYPIAKFWMDSELTRSQQSSLRPTMLWINFQTQGDILNYDIYNQKKPQS
jgi:hypothetical protein